MTNNNSISLKATGFIAISGLSAVAIMAAFDTAATFINTLPRATVERLADTIPVTIMGLCGLASMGGVLIAWAFSIARMRPASASVGQQQLAPQIEIRKPLQLQLPPMPPTEPRFVAWRGDIVSQIQREQQRAQHADDADNGPENPEIATFTSDYGFQPQYDDEPQMPQYAPEPPPIATNQRIVARLGNGDDISISAAAWLAFASLDKPNRDDWRMSLKSSGNSAPNSDYGKCKQIADQYHLLSGAGVWISPKMRDTITQWLTQP